MDHWINALMNNSFQNKAKCQDFLRLLLSFEL